MQVRKSILHLTLLSSILIPCFGWAQSFPVAGRFFIGSSSINPEDLNEEMTAQSLVEVDSVSLLGFEANQPLGPMEWGFRYTKRYASKDELVDDPNTMYNGRLSQDSVMLVLRVPLLKNGKFRADVFAAGGGCKTKFEINVPFQDGKMTSGDSWFGSYSTAAGASVGVGFDKFFLILEGGYELNKVDKFERSGTINNNVQEIDLSGSYFTIGLLFDGLKASSK